MSQDFYAVIYLVQPYQDERRIRPRTMRMSVHKEVHTIPVDVNFSFVLTERCQLYTEQCRSVYLSTEPKTSTRRNTQYFYDLFYRCFIALINLTD